MYAIILAILMILELAGLILAFVYKGKITEVYEGTFSDVLVQAVRKNQSDVLNIFHEMEKTMKCCGVRGPSDYRGHEYNEGEYCRANPNARGCAASIIDFLNTNLPIIGGTLGGVLLLELFGLIGAIALAVAIKHAPKESYSSSPSKVISYAVRRN